MRDANEATVDNLRNSTLRALDLVGSYQLTGQGGPRRVPAGNSFEDLFGGADGVIPGGYRDALQSIGNADYPVWRVQLQMTYPLGQSADRAAYERARLELQQNRALIRRIELRIASEVTNAALRIESIRDRIAAATASRELAEEQLQAEESKFEVGLVDELLRPAVATRSGHGTGCRAARDSGLPAGADRVRADAARFARRGRQRDGRRRCGPRRRRTVGADADAAALIEREQPDRRTYRRSRTRRSLHGSRQVAAGRCAGARLHLRRCSRGIRRPPPTAQPAPVERGRRQVLLPRHRNRPRVEPSCAHRSRTAHLSVQPPPGASIVAATVDHDQIRCLPALDFAPVFWHDDALTCVTAGTPLAGVAQLVGERVRTADVRLLRGPDKVLPWSPVQSERRLHTELCTTRTIADAIHQDLRGFMQCPRLSHRTPTDRRHPAIVANGKVISGRSCRPWRGPEACVIMAHYARTGRNSGACSTLAHCDAVERRRPPHQRRRRSTGARSPRR